MRLVPVILTAICAVLASAAAASTYPTSGASTFDRNAQGWTSLGTSCTVTTGGGLTSLCAQTNTYDGTVGNPKGSIASTTHVVANGGGLFRGQGTWRSPTFTASASAVSGVLELDRRFDIAAPLVTLDPSANLRAALVDERSGARAQLLNEDLSVVTGQFAKRRAAFGADTLVNGPRYHIELTTTTTTKTARIGLVGDLVARYDNVQLTVNDAPGASGTQGVTFPGSPISSNRFGYLARRLSINAQAGRGPGGTLVPISECTILGTPGNDRITGSTGNDVICGLGGNDRLSGSPGSDLVVGLRGRDRLSGSSGNDRLGGGGGKDRLSGGSGRDRLAGGSSNDRLGGGSGSDRLSGGRGRDRIGGGPGNDRISAKDRTRDRVDGGRDRDTATVDRPRSRASRRGVRAPRVDRVRRVDGCGANSLANRIPRRRHRHRLESPARGGPDKHAPWVGLRGRRPAALTRDPAHRPRDGIERTRGNGRAWLAPSSHSRCPSSSAVRARVEGPAPPLPIAKGTHRWQTDRMAGEGRPQRADQPEWLRLECRLRWERVEALHDELDLLPSWRFRKRRRIHLELDQATRSAEDAAELFANLQSPLGQEEPRL